MNYIDNYTKWSTDAYFNEETRNELLALKGNEKEIEDRFYKELEFGTGGLRGVIGAGTNRMNIYTVKKATQGLADYILDQKIDSELAVAIAYDSRRFSPEFAKEAALTLNGNGIKAYVFDELRPTPELSFAVRELGVTAGIVVTASHNPPEYNGYKVYWSDGGQVPYPRDEEIITYVNKIQDYSTIKNMDYNEAVSKGLYISIGKQIDDEFTRNIKLQMINPDIVREMSDRLSIVYTPLHGTGNKPVRRVLEEAGFKNVHVVPEQEKPDSDFTTVKYPNPEDPDAFKLAIRLAENIHADLIIGTDPDADRIGVAVRDTSGKYAILSGNMIGILLCDYILSQKKEKNLLEQNGAIVSTIVSTDMTAAIAKNYHVSLFKVLTGFKYIGEKIKEFEETGSNTFLFGFEESYGCLVGTHARDKDAVVASLLVCEMAAYHKKNGMSLYDALNVLYEKYGYYKEDIRSITLKGVEGLNNMKKIMEWLRTNPPKQINEGFVIKVNDYLTRKAYDALDHKSTDIDLPVSNVLYYETDDGSWFCVRPSGTEPKIKIYFGAKENSDSEVKSKIEANIKAMMTIIDDIAL